MSQRHLLVAYGTLSLEAVEMRWTGAPVDLVRARPPLFEARWVQEVLADWHSDDWSKRTKGLHANNAAGLLVLILHRLIEKELVVILHFPQVHHLLLEVLASFHQSTKLERHLVVGHFEFLHDPLLVYFIVGHEVSSMESLEPVAR